MQWPQAIQPKSGLSDCLALLFSIIRPKSLHTDTHEPQPIQLSSFILISALTLVLDVGIAIHPLIVYNTPAGSATCNTGKTGSRQYQSVALTASIKFLSFRSLSVPELRTPEHKSTPNGLTARIASPTFSASSPPARNTGMVDSLTI